MQPPLAPAAPARPGAEGRRGPVLSRPSAGGRFDPEAVWDRLLPEFAGRLDSSIVQRTVWDCVADISAVPVPALPELVERSARHRLTVLLDHQPRQPSGRLDATPPPPGRGPAVPPATGAVD